MCLPRRYTKYERMTRRAHTEIDKNLDLRKFIMRQRVASMTSLGLLTKDQSIFAHKMGQIVLPESTGLSSEEFDPQYKAEGDILRMMDQHANKLLKSNNATD